MSPFDLSNYQPVEDRLAAFWSDHPDGRVLTELVKAEGGEFIVKASVWRETIDTRTVMVPGEVPVHYREASIAPPDATGFAQELATDRGVNSTSALENCETSAIGRALANLGYASKKDPRPSREEMSKVSRRTSGSGTPSHPKVETGRELSPSPSVAESDASAPPVIGSGGTAESGSGVAADGEAAAAPDPGQLPHEAVWIQSPKVKSMVVCEVPRCVLHPARRKDQVPA